MLSDYEYLKLTKQSVLLNKIKINNKKLIKERLAKNYDYSNLNGVESAILYSIFSSKGINIKSQHQGIISDVRILDLKKCIKKIESKVPKSVDDADENIGKTSLGKINVKPIQVNIKCTIGDQLSIGRSLLSIDCDEDVWNKIKIESFEKEINGCYKIIESKHPDQNLKNIFLRIEDRLIQSIQEKRRSTIDESIDTIIEIIQNFETLLSYDYDNAQKEFNNIGGGWSCIKYIVKILHSSVEESILSSDIDIITRIITLPYSVLVSAINNKDHYVFNEILFVFPYLYHLSKKHQNEYINKIIISKSINLPVEISNLYISQFVKDAKPNEITSVFNFSTKLLKIHQDIIKMMVDNDESIDIYSQGIKKFKIVYNSVCKLIKKGA